MSLCKFGPGAYVLLRKYISLRVLDRRRAAVPAMPPQPRYDLAPEVSRLVRVVVALQHAPQVTRRELPRAGEYLRLQLTGAPPRVPREKLGGEKKSAWKKKAYGMAQRRES